MLPYCSVNEAFGNASLLKLHADDLMDGSCRNCEPRLWTHRRTRNSLSVICVFFCITIKNILLVFFPHCSFFSPIFTRFQNMTPDPKQKKYVSTFVCWEDKRHPFTFTVELSSSFFFFSFFLEERKKSTSLNVQYSNVVSLVPTATHTHTCARARTRQGLTATRHLHHTHTHTATSPLRRSVSNDNCSLFPSPSGTRPQADDVVVVVVVVVAAVARPQPQYSGVVCCLVLDGDSGDSSAVHEEEKLQGASWWWAVRKQEGACVGGGGGGSVGGGGGGGGVADGGGG